MHFSRTAALAINFQYYCFLLSMSGGPYLRPRKLLKYYKLNYWHSSERQAQYSLLQQPDNMIPLSLVIVLLVWTLLHVFYHVIEF